MKKKYITPNAVEILLNIEDSILVTVSGGGSSEKVDNFNNNTGGSQDQYEGDLTRRNNSLWDYWTE